ncbi:EamA family transporter [Gemmobacter lutimaris]|uniref:EamA family transporter n=1 Tax=Gemmobacter lutimaris TaxID=2306023 RepID=A0A398BS19_9RHOB|nr:EamA family transporter [Gemmobacter lutimaris]RID93222.1 EamA family transporter [Gemmobacter lutimaris]
MTQGRATAIGFSAVLLWALLALFTIGSSPVPPFQLNAICFAIGGGLGLARVLASGEGAVLRRVPWYVYAFGTIGLFGYHALYFTAFRIAPSAETGLIAYLWPLFIVLLSGLLPGERLQAGHILGALIAFAGAALIVLGRDGGQANAAGLVLAFGCAITWAVYSVASRALGQVPTAAVAVYCLATAALSAIVHLLIEPTLWPETATGWLSVLALGLGPVGLAFFTWDIGMKKGDIQLLGVASYAAPLLSTLALVVAGIASPSLALLVSAVLITGGAALAARSRPARPSAKRGQA